MDGHTSLLLIHYYVGGKPDTEDNITVSLGNTGRGNSTYRKFETLVFNVKQ